MHQVIAERDHVPSFAAHLLRMRLLVPRYEAVYFGSGLYNRNTRTEPADHEEKMIVVALRQLWSNVREQRHPNFHRPVRKSEAARHHADDFGIPSVQPHLLMNDSRAAAETPLPEAIADHHYPRRPQPVFIRSKAAAE